MNSSTPKRAIGAVVLGALRRHDRRHAHRFSADAMRNSSRRTSDWSWNWLNMAPSESMETRVAPTLLHGVLHARQQRAQVEAAALDDLDLGDPATRRRWRARRPAPTAARSQPKLRMFCRMSRGDSSKVTKTPCSPAAMPGREELHREDRLAAARRARDSSVVRCIGSPPSAIMSKLAIPVGSFWTPRPFVGRVRSWVHHSFPSSPGIIRPDVQPEQHLVLVETDRR
jgi:hypothetical protein